ncbi:hypothetical protein [Hydrogenophaga sp. OTU3427]|uniref:hypothetical protein n=1 Tax=Hydrogenophaga sp. OTU3427 TaxID=3043856 RepID=UPI00313CD125
MNRPTEPTPPVNDLRAALRQSLHRADAAPAESDADAAAEALQQRVLAQWQQRHAHLHTHPAWAVAGGSTGGRRPATRWWLAGTLLVVLALGLAWSQRPDPTLEELLQPDVLSQMGLGEL